MARFGPDAALPNVLMALGRPAWSVQGQVSGMV